MRSETRESVESCGASSHNTPVTARGSAHVARGASLTVAAIEVPLADSRRFGILDVDEDNRVTGFQEKPAAGRPAPWNPAYCLGSIGVYVFDFDALVGALTRDEDRQSSHDFGKDLIPYVVRHGKAMAHRFADSCVRSEGDGEAYWREDMVRVENMGAALGTGTDERLIAKRPLQASPDRKGRLAVRR